MTRDEVLEMARKAGFRVTLINSIEGDEVIGQGDNGVIVTDELERFAALVAERTREECARVCDSLATGEGDEEYASGVSLCVSTIRKSAGSVL